MVRDAGQKLDAYLLLLYISFAIFCLCLLSMALHLQGCVGTLKLISGCLFSREDLAGSLAPLSDKIRPKQEH